MDTFATAVLEARTSQQLSQRSAAARCAVTQQYLSRIERGTRVPSLPVYARIVRALGLTPGVGLDA